MIRTQSYAIEPIDNTKPHPKNPRRGDLEAIEASIAVNGFYGAVGAQATTGLIIFGNHRWRAMKARGASEIAVIRIECTDAEAERMAMADNRTHDLGAGYDPALLAEQMQRVLDGLGSLDGTGHTKLDLAKLRADADAAARSALEGLNGAGGPSSPPPSAKPKEDLDDPTKWKIPNDPITQPGDIWLLGEHRIICADAFHEWARAALFAGAVADLILADPPFAIFGSSTGIGADIADDKMIRPFFQQLARIIKQSVRDFAHVYLCCDWRSYATIYDANRLAGLSPKNCVVWDKGNGGLGSSYANCYELISFFAKLPPPTAMRSTSQRGQRTVMAPNIARYNRVPTDDKFHNAQKPIPLFEWLIQNSSEPGELVVDFFLGSGTTLIAAEKTGRRCFGFDLEPKYLDLHVWRWEQLTGKKATRVPAAEHMPEPAPEPNVEPT